jgi:uncharacterized lipoprotein NlpE involved in copper resistance
VKKAIVILFVGLMISFGLVGCDSATDQEKASCAWRAKEAKTDAAAKLIYKTCVKEAS